MKVRFVQTCPRSSGKGVAFHLRNLVMRRRLAIFALLAGCFTLGCALGSSKAVAACNTGDAGCQGRARFVNNDGKIMCFSVFYANGGQSNFCLRHKDDDHYVDVRTGDRYCYVVGDYAPPSDCNRQAINTD